MRRIWLLSALLAASAYAIDDIGLTARNVDGHGIHIGSVELAVSGLNDADQVLHIDLRGLVLPAPLGEFGAARVDCAHGRIERDAIHCRGGRVHLGWDVLDRPEFVADFDVRLDSGDLQAELKGLQLAGGRADLRVDARADDLRVDLTSHDIELPRALALAARFGVATPGWSVSAGKAELRASARMHESRPLHVDWRLRLSELAGGNDAGTVASDAAVVASHGAVDWRNGRPVIDARLSLEHGQFYVDPVFVELNDTPIELALKGRQTRDGWALEDAGVSDAGRLRVRASGSLDGDFRPRALDVQIVELALGPSYKRYAQPLLVDGALANLDLAGSVTGKLRLDGAGLTALRLSLPRVDLDDREGRFGVYGLKADIDWRRDAERESRLQWNAAHVYKLDLGAVDWRVRGDGKAMRMVPPVRLPVLDGALVIDAMALTGLDGAPGGHFEGYLEPISMAALSHAFGWPAMEGKVSGMIPGISYQDGRLGVDGVLLMRVFDGNVTLRDVVIDEPFGIAPALRGNLDLRNLDLESLTRTFAFGAITGRLDGWMHELRMVNWQPVAFDAGFETPVDDDSRHRISQKAVDNLTSLGGVSGALSRTFMRFFENFSYDRLGLNCKLRNEVCAMGGVLPVADEPGRYYIVKGGGLPRIDVIGYAQRVDWPTLLERIRRVTSGAGPQIQ